MENILSAAEEILGTAVRVEDHRNWAIFWCPFHNDASREGAGGQPNFGVNLQSGYWKCLRCGASGGSLKLLRTKLGQDWKPSVSMMIPARPKRPPTKVQLLDEAVPEARSCVQRSPAWNYLTELGVTPLSPTGLDANNQDVSDVKDLVFNDPTTGTINQSAGALIVDNLMAKERENTMTTAGGIAFPVISDVAGEVDSLRIPALAGVPTASPTNGGEGHLVWDSTNNHLYAWDGAAWDNLSTVDEAKSVVNSYLAGVAIAANEEVYISAADTVEKALADNTSKSYMMGFAKAGAALGNPLPVQSEGLLSGFSGLTAGSRYYLDDTTAGAITSTIPSGSGNTIVQVGYAKNTTNLQIHIEQMGRRA